jgi:hypothetical protein
MTVKFKAKGSKAQVSQELYSGGKKLAETTTEEEVVTPSGLIAKAGDATVGISLGATRNLGDYNSAKGQVTLTMPCNTTEINDTYDFVLEWVDSKLEAIVNKLDA